VARCIISIIENAILLNDPDFKLKLAEEYISWEGPSDFELSALIEIILNHLGCEARKEDILDSLNLHVVLRMIESSLLIFFRKCVLILYARFGYVPAGGQIGFGHEFSSTNTPDYSSVKEYAPEYERLSNYLYIPTLKSMITRMNGDQKIKSLVKHWCSQLIKIKPFFNNQNELIPRSPVVLIHQPIIYQLVFLPKRLDVLFQTSLERICKSCQMVPQDPAICLFCGTYVF
jgi:E3 ubiquitin-protein ligase UBR1